MSFANIFTRVFKNNKKSSECNFYVFSIEFQLILSGRGDLWTWNSGREGGYSGNPPPGNPGGGGFKKSCHPSAVCGFFLE